MHCPLWQTKPAPHGVPFGWSFDSVQTGAPVAQEMVPLRHGFPFTAQAAPAVHAAQLPLMQTMSSPQTVPFACSSEGVQTAPFDPQVVTPTRHGLDDAQGAPALQIGTSTPPSVLSPCPGATAGPADPRGAAAVRQIGRGAQARATKPRADQK